MKMLPVEIQRCVRNVLLKSDHPVVSCNSLIGPTSLGPSKTLVALMDLSEPGISSSVFGYSVWQSSCEKQIAFTEDLAEALEHYDNCNNALWDPESKCLLVSDRFAKDRTPAQVAKEAGQKDFE